MGAVDLGLVLHATSDTLRVERHPTRLNRLRKAVITCGRLHSETANKWGLRGAMVTLTYRPGVLWDAGHITGFLKSAREYLRRKGHAFRYVWVMELTQRGVPHYHVLIWLPKGITFPKPDKRGWWPHGMTRIEWVKKAVGYLAKYASKGCEPDDIPRGARLHGVGGLDAEQRAEKSWWMKPGWCRELFGIEDDVVRAAGGGYVSRDHGHWEPPRWGLRGNARDWSWIDLVRLEQRYDL